MSVREPDEFLTVAEIAAILKLKQQTIRNSIIDDTFSAILLGWRVRLRRSVLGDC